MCHNGGAKVFPTAKNIGMLQHVLIWLTGLKRLVYDKNYL